MSKFTQCAAFIATASVLLLSSCQQDCPKCECPQTAAQCQCNQDGKQCQCNQDGKQCQCNQDGAQCQCNQDGKQCQCQHHQDAQAAAADNTPAAVADNAATSGNGVLKRADIDDKYKWNKSRLFESNDAFQAALTKTTEDIKQISACSDFDSASRLKECLDLYFNLHTAVNKLTLYANMTVDTEPGTESNLMQQRAKGVLDDFMARATTVRDALLKLSAETLEAFFNEEPGLKPHESYIRNIARRANRVLSPDAERVLSLAGDNLWAEIDLNEIHSNAENTFDAMIDALSLPMIKDEAGKDVQLTLSNYPKYRRSTNRDVRKAAVNALMSALAKYKDVLANTYIGQVQQDILFARARNYNTALEAYLDKDNLPVELYKNLIDTVGANLEPLHKYVALRKKVMNVDTVHLYDLYIPLADIENTKSYTYEEATSLIATALAPLGEDYITRLKAEMDPAKGSIDLLPHEGKTSGAYSCSVYGISPFILTNFQNDLDDVSTLAHELGHSMHSIYSMENQPAGSAHYTMFLAEIASTTNESILNDYLLSHATTDAEKINLLVQKLENIRGTIYRQTLFAEFEYRAHTAIENGEAINADWLSKLYADLITKYYGPDYTIDANDGFEWSYVPHFYYKYYVYSYATGLSSALAFARLIEASPENADKYINMLKSGSVKDSVTLLREAGVDLTTPAPIADALKEFGDTVDQLEKLLVK